jgi:D-beta-D-heptose 7-phosphate kinase/D-beta-D-heptose 1-phosphate adenosyltransferase
MFETLLKTVTHLGSPKLLVVGDFMLDVYIYGDATRISPEAPVPVLKIKNQQQSCGGAASVAVDIAALGAVPHCLGVVGDDEAAGQLRRLLVDAGADISGLITSTDRPTITKTRLIGLAQHRHQQQLFRMDAEITEALPEAAVQAILASYEKSLQDTDIVCLQDYNKGLLTPEVCGELIDRARRAGKTVLVDPAAGTDYSKYRGASAITPNRQETSLAVGHDIDCEADYVRAATDLKDRLDLEAVIITLDKDGAYLKTDEQEGLIPTRPRRVYDVTGAGDMVLATLGTALAAGCDYITSVQLANIAGGIEVEKFGVATVTIPEIVNELMGQQRSKTGKVRELEALLTELEWHRQQQARIVFTNGCFDVLHRGHIEYLRFCKEQGNLVVVGLNSDRSVRTLKGPDRPVNPEDDRAAVLAALETVDYVTIFDEADPHALIS